MKPSLTFRIVTLVCIFAIMHALSIAIMHLLAICNGINIDTLESSKSFLLDTNNMAITKSYIAISHILTFIITSLIWCYIFYRNHMVKYFKLKHFDPRYIALFVIALFSLFPAISVATYWIEQIDFPPIFDSLEAESAEILSKLLIMENPLHLIVNVLLIGIIPGIGEEMLFRGILQKQLIRKWRRPNIAIWVSAILFSALHLQIVGFLPKLVIGLILGYAYYYSGSLLLSMFLHSINNSIAVVAFYFTDQNKLSEIKSTAMEPPILAALFGMIIFAFIWFKIQSIHKTKYQ